MKFIFEIKVKEGHSEQDYISAWKNGSSIIQASEGAQGTVLYRKIGEPGILIAIAKWESKELRDTAMKKLDGADTKVKKVLNQHKDYGETKVLGNFEEIDRIEPSV